ncbi:MAG: hypothetical protein K2O67_01150 [Clostridia bacterium]|nr:hypothetical protein [Clostridia bacterium]
MNKKLFLGTVIGVLTAGMLCFIAALIAYFIVKVNNPISALITLFAMAAGAIITLFALLVLFITLIANSISKSKNK